MASIFPSAGTGIELESTRGKLSFSSDYIYICDTFLNGYLVPDVDRTVKHMQTPSVVRKLSQAGRLKIDSKIVGCLSDFPSFRGFPRNFSA